MLLSQAGAWDLKPFVEEGMQELKMFGFRQGLELCRCMCGKLQILAATSSREILSIQNSREVGMLG